MATKASTSVFTSNKNSLIDESSSDDDDDFLSQIGLKDSKTQDSQNPTKNALSNTYKTLPLSKAMNSLLLRLRQTAWVCHLGILSATQTKGNAFTHSLLFADPRGQRGKNNSNNNNNSSSPFDPETSLDPQSILWGEKIFHDIVDTENRIPQFTVLSTGTRLGTAVSADGNLLKYYYGMETNPEVDGTRDHLGRAVKIQIENKNPSSSSSYSINDFQQQQPPTNL